MTETVRCHDCQQRVRWCLTEGARRMPVDPEPNPAGNLVRAGTLNGTPIVHVVTKDEEVPAGEPRYMPHFATCTGPRGKRKK